MLFMDHSGSMNVGPIMSDHLLKTTQPRGSGADPLLGPPRNVSNVTLFGTRTSTESQQHDHIYNLDLYRQKPIGP